MPWPTRMVSAGGTKRHAATCWVAVSSLVNCAKVVEPARIHAPGPRTALNDAESHWSCRLTSVFATMALVTFLSPQPASSVTTMATPIGARCLDVGRMSDLFGRWVEVEAQILERAGLSAS